MRSAFGLFALVAMLGCDKSSPAPSSSAPPSPPSAPSAADPVKADPVKAGPGVGKALATATSLERSGPRAAGPSR